MKMKIILLSSLFGVSLLLSEGHAATWSLCGKGFAHKELECRKKSCEGNEKTYAKGFKSWGHCNRKMAKMLGEK